MKCSRLSPPFYSLHSPPYYILFCVLFIDLNSFIYHIAPPFAIFYLFKHIELNVPAFSQLAEVSAAPDYPFSRHDGRTSLYEVLRTLVCTLLLLPLRAFAVILLITLYYVIAKIATWRVKDLLQPLAPWRRSLLQSGRVLTRGCLFAFGFIYIKTKGSIKVSPPHFSSPPPLSPSLLSPSLLSPSLLSPSLLSPSLLSPSLLSPFLLSPSPLALSSRPREK
jgi:hypothetical protein